MMTLIFLLSLAAFLLVILFLAWYTMAVSEKILGGMRRDLAAVLLEGVPPARWDIRLRKKLRGCSNGEQRRKALEGHRKYVGAQLRDMRACLEKTPDPPGEERSGDVAALERFQEEYNRFLDERLHNSYKE